MTKLPATLPRKIDQATKYGRELARLNVTKVMIGKLRPEELDDLVDRHLVDVVTNIEKNSDMTVDGMKDAIDVVARTIREAFVEETKVMLLNQSTTSGRA